MGVNVLRDVLVIFMAFFISRISIFIAVISSKDGPKSGLAMDFCNAATTIKRPLPYRRPYWPPSVPGKCDRMVSICKFFIIIVWTEKKELEDSSDYGIPMSLTICLAPTACVLSSRGGGDKRFWEKIPSSTFPIINDARHQLDSETNSSNY